MKGQGSIEKQHRIQNFWDECEGFCTFVQKYTNIHRWLLGSFGISVGQSGHMLSNMQANKQHDNVTKDSTIRHLLHHHIILQDFQCQSKVHLGLVLS